MPVVLDTRQFVLNLVYDENTLSYVPEPYAAAGAGPSSDVTVLNFPATQPVSGTVGVSGTVTVSGTATVSNGGTFPVQATETRPGTSSVTSVASSASSVSLLASNANRRAATIYNDSSADLYVKFGATASSSSFTVKMAANSYFEFPQPCYTGAVDGIWGSATGAARLTELT